MIKVKDIEVGDLVTVNPKLFKNNRLEDYCNKYFNSWGLFNKAGLAEVKSKYGNQVLCEVLEVYTRDFSDYPKTVFVHIALGNEENGFTFRPMHLNKIFEQ